MAITDKITANEVQFDAEEVVWDDIRNAVHMINPELTKICDQINPGKKHSFFKFNYSYGDLIVDHGQYQLRTEKHGLISIKDPRIPDYLRKKLSYCPIPLSLILQRSNEVFVQHDDKVIPLNFFYSGELFGVFETMNPLLHTFERPSWSVSAGARTVFFLPRISDATGHKRIQRNYNITTDIPTYIIGCAYGL